jgi:hypothetical protein
VCLPFASFRILVPSDGSFILARFTQPLL